MTRRTKHRRIPVLVFAFVALIASTAAHPGEWVFVERSAEVGLDFEHAYVPAMTNGWHWESGGLAIGDLNGDGWDDIYAVTGEPDAARGPVSNANKLFISNQDGTYTDQAAAWGLSSSDEFSTGPIIADFNGDGHRDLIVGGVKGKNDPINLPDRVRVYMNTGASSFTDATVSSGLFALIDRSTNFGFAASDINKDGDLDLFVTHWQGPGQPKLFENNGSGVFSDITATHLSGAEPLTMFTPIFVDINNDGWDDLLLSSDFKNSTYFLNDGAGSFIQQDPSPLTDENGMGGAVGDYDNDGDFDWFTTSIYDTDQIVEPPGAWSINGNRLYNNNGSGMWTDVTDVAGVRIGYWGWGACFADFNNDMYLDLYHVNGFYTATLMGTAEDEFETDPARMFVNNGNGTFTEMSNVLGVDDTGQGRAVLCFDSDHDGDLDILVHNNQGVSRFFENEAPGENHWMQIRLFQPGAA